MTDAELIAAWDAMIGEQMFNLDEAGFFDHPPLPDGTRSDEDLERLRRGAIMSG